LRFPYPVAECGTMMPRDDIRAADKLALRGKSKEQLAALAVRYLPVEEVQGADRFRLIEALSRTASTNEQLAAELAESEIAIKPSFYLMLLDPSGENASAEVAALERLRSILSVLNTELERTQDLPHYKGFAAEEVHQVAEGVVEVWFTWQRAHGYWHPDDFSRTHIYEAQFGLAILDLNSRKAIVACHDRKEREHLTEALSRMYSANLTAMTLTQPILDRIGSFDNVKRAGYFVSNVSGDVPSNISYADENLSTIEMARTEERSFRSQRKHSFYRIPLGHLVETGVGATSDSGKLWIPREVPLSLVREYSLRLLGRVSETLNELTQRGDTDEVLDAVGISGLPKMQTIRPVRLRKEVSELFAQLVNMLVAGESERSFTPGEALITDGVPRLFLHPRLELTDPADSGDVAFWRDAEEDSQQVKVSRSGGELLFKERRSGETLNLSQLTHPITGGTVDVEEPLRALELVPTPQLAEALMQATERASGQIELLRRVRFLPFRVSAGRLRLDVDRALGRTGPGEPDILLDPQEVDELRSALSRGAPEGADRERLDKTLIGLGEKCPHMADENCRPCVEDRTQLCLRSLVARPFRSRLLLAHKGIELSDVQFTATVNDEPVRVFGFAKLGKANKAKTKTSGLTARNEN
jgi:hypothetical protein